MLKFEQLPRTNENDPHDAMRGRKGANKERSSSCRVPMPNLVVFRLAWMFVTKDIISIMDSDILPVACPTL